MRRILALSLVVILLLNVMGYFFVFVGIQYSQDVAFLKILDTGEYNLQHTVTLKLPLPIPYMSDDAEFERVDGLFEHKGEHYRLVKQKYANDTLHLVCIVDHDKKEIDQQMENYVRSFSDQSADHGRSGKLSVSFIKDYLPQYLFVRTAASGWCEEVFYLQCTQNLSTSFRALIVPPPKTV